MVVAAESDRTGADVVHPIVRDAVAHPAAVEHGESVALEGDHAGVGLVHTLSVLLDREAVEGRDLDNGVSCLYRTFPQRIIYSLSGEVKDDCRADTLGFQADMPSMINRKPVGSVACYVHASGVQQCPVHGIYQGQRRSEMAGFSHRLA